MKTLPKDIEFSGGTVRLTGEYVIEGRVDGRVESDDTIVVGPNAHVSGEIVAKNVLVHGRVDGVIVAKECCTLTATSVVEGGVKALRLCIKEGATYIGETKAQPPPHSKAA